MFVGKFTDFYRDVTKKGTKISQEEYKEIGSYPIIDQGKKLIAGRWDNGEGVFDDVPAIIFGDHTRAIKYIEEPFFIGADGVKILRPTNAQDSTKYLYYALQAARIPNLGYSRHFKALKELEIRVYSREEQDEIVRVLDKIDHLIEQRYKEISCLNQLVKSRFVELFGDPASNSPKWDTGRLGDYMTTLTDFSANGSYALLDSQVVMYDEPHYAIMVRTTDLETGDLKNGVKYIDQKAYELLGKSKLFGGEMIMNKIGSAGKIYIMPHIETPASLGRNAFMFRFDQRVNMVFLYALLTSEYGTAEIQQHVRGAVTKTITKESTRSIRIIVPPIELQQQFAVFVKQVDKSKLAVQKSLDELETLKKSLMQQYFG